MPERRAYICLRCSPPTRVFVGPDDKVPKCPRHGKMIRQTNKRYPPQPVRDPTRRAR